MNWNDQVPLWAVFVFIGFVLLVAVIAVWHDNRIRAKNGGVNPKEEEAKARMERIQATNRAKREQNRIAHTVVKTKILDSHSTMTSKGSVASSVGRAAVGNFIAGPIGAVAGASTGKRTYHEYKNTTFKVWYGDGSTKIKTVSNGSYDWKQYMEKLEE